MIRSRGRIIGTLLLAPGVLLGFARPAAAHLVSSGMGNFYDGVLHPVTSLDQALPLLALALWAGGRGAAATRWAVLALPLGWLIGHGLGAPAAYALPFAMAAALCGLLAGVFAAASLAVNAPGMGAAAFLCGVVLGSAAGSSESAPSLVFALGSALAGAFVLLLAGAERSHLRSEVQTIAARVAGSWIAAASLLQTGWLIRGVGHG